MAKVAVFVLPLSLAFTACSTAPITRSVSDAASVRPYDAAVAARGDADGLYHHPLAALGRTVSTASVWRKEELRTDSRLNRYLGVRHRVYVNRIVGSQIVSTGVPGISANDLQRAIDSHLHALAAGEKDLPEMRDCPLAVDGVKVTVGRSGTQLVVTLTADDPGRVRTLLDRVDRQLGR